VQNAFGGQELSEKKLKALVDTIYKDIQEQGNKVQSEFIGETVLSHLKEVNQVAYVRFASVYKEFSDASDFEKEAAEFN
jgi:transcriptional repressor NrdR